MTSNEKQMFKTGENPHLCQNDEKFSCSNMNRTVKNFTEICRSFENPECWIRCLQMHIRRLVTLELKCGCFGFAHWSKCHESASGTQLVQDNLGRWHCSKSRLLQTVGSFFFNVALLLSSN